MEMRFFVFLYIKSPFMKTDFRLHEWGIFVCRLSVLFLDIYRKI
jgi:hypothetical protein